jgi:hypothetical protein
MLKKLVCCKLYYQRYRSCRLPGQSTVDHCFELDAVGKHRKWARKTVLHRTRGMGVPGVFYYFCSMAGIRQKRDLKADVWRPGGSAHLCARMWTVVNLRRDFGSGWYDNLGTPQPLVTWTRFQSTWELYSASRRQKSENHIKLGRKCRDSDAVRNVA